MSVSLLSKNFYLYSIWLGDEVQWLKKSNTILRTVKINSNIFITFANSFFKLQKAETAH